MPGLKIKQGLCLTTWDGFDSWDILHEKIIRGLKYPHLSPRTEYPRKESV
jgi:hypothetical protein